MTRYQKATIDIYLSFIGYGFAMNMLPSHPYLGLCLAIFFGVAFYFDARRLYWAGVNGERERMSPWIYNALRARAVEVDAQMKQETQKNTTDKP